MSLVQIVLLAWVDLASMGERPRDTNEEDTEQREPHRWLATLELAKAFVTLLLLALSSTLPAVSTPRR